MPSQEEIDRWTAEGVPQEEWFGRQIVERMQAMEDPGFQERLAALRQEIIELEAGEDHIVRGEN